MSRHFILLLWLTEKFVWNNCIEITDGTNITIISRDEWDSRDPKIDIPDMILPVPLVVLHDTSIRKDNLSMACNTTEGCKEHMRAIQKYHYTFENMFDIGYHFAVGSDGVVYEGRGWFPYGAHTFGFNNMSIGIVLIGDWSSELPPKIQLQAVKSLIALGVKDGYIMPNYQLIGHRQVRPEACPGDLLYNELKTWPNFNSTIKADNFIYPSDNKPVKIGDNIVDNYTKEE